MARHPVSARIDEAAQFLERHGVTVTPDHLRAQVRKLVTYADVGSDEMLDAVIDRYLPSRMRALGYVITDSDTRERKQFWDATVSELRVQLKVKQTSSSYDMQRLVADEAVVRFLEAKEQELGYEPYPELFKDEIDRIFRMHGVSVPA